MGWKELVPQIVAHCAEIGLVAELVLLIHRQILVRVRPPDSIVAVRLMSLEILSLRRLHRHHVHDALTVFRLLAIQESLLEILVNIFLIDLVLDDEIVLLLYGRHLVRHVLDLVLEVEVGLHIHSIINQLVSLLTLQSWDIFVCSQLVHLLLWLGLLRLAAR